MPFLFALYTKRGAGTRMSESKSAHFSPPDRTAGHAGVGQGRRRTMKISGSLIRGGVDVV